MFCNLKVEKKSHVDKKKIIINDRPIYIKTRKDYKGNKL